MNKWVARVLVMIGVMLIVVGIAAMHSFRSDVFRFFAGAPTDKSVWTLIAGSLIAILGLSAPPAEQAAGSREGGTENAREARS